jgi:hypothetical protein
MPDLTEEEYDALDEYWTKNTLKMSGDGKSGFFAKRKDTILHPIVIFNSNELY